MYHVSAQGVDERMINVHYYYYYYYWLLRIKLIMRGLRERLRRCRRETSGGGSQGMG